MPRLQEFVGTREYPSKAQVSASGFVMHQSSKNERMRAIIQGLASSTDPPQSKSIYGSQGDVFSGFQPKQDESNGSPSPVLGMPEISSASVINNTRWHGYRPVVRASQSTNDLPPQDPMEGTSPDHDIFGTDIENLDSTVASSDGASSDFEDIQSRHEQGDKGDIGIGVFTSSTQRMRRGQPQQGSMLLKREYNEHRNDGYAVPIDKDGKDRKSIIDGNNNDQKLDEMDRLARNFHPKVLACDTGILFQESTRATNVRGNSMPTITKPTFKLTSSGNSMESSASTVNSGSLYRQRSAFHVSNGELGARSLHASETRQEEVKESEGDKYNHFLKGSSEAELNRTNALAAPLIP